MSKVLGSEVEGTVQEGEPLVEIDGLKKYFAADSGFFAGVDFEPDRFPPFTTGVDQVKAVDGVTFDIRKGETLGLVGESGCGKSTLGRTILRLLEPTDGHIYFKDEDLAALGGEALRQKRAEMQMIFQDPQSSLDPRMKVGQIIEEPMRAHGMPKSDPAVETVADVTVDGVDAPVEVTVANEADLVVEPEDGVSRVPVRVHRDGVGGDDVAASVPDHLAADVDVAENGTIRVDVTVSASKGELRRERAQVLLEKVGLDPQHYNRYPHAFSGGQRQRVNLARALSVNPDFIVCDEPVSALDVSIQAQVLNTMEELQEEFGLTYLFIAHDLSVIRHISDRVAVMYLGNVVELADKEELFENPQHPYTRALLESIPVPDPRDDGDRDALEGEVPSPIDPPSGCRFRTRCPKLIAPAEYDLTDGEWVATRAFMRAVDRRSFESKPAGEIRRQFFGDATPGGEAGTIVDEAIELVAADEAAETGESGATDAWRTAAALLTSSFAERSICAREEPAYEVPTAYGEGRHVSACHRNRDAAGGD